MPELEDGARWWIRYVVVPLIGGGGLIAILVAIISNQRNHSDEPKQPHPMPPIATGAAKDTTDDAHQSPTLVHTGSPTPSSGANEPDPLVTEMVSQLVIELHIDDDDKDQEDSVEFKLFVENEEEARFTIGAGHVWADRRTVHITIVPSGVPRTTDPVVVNNEYHYTIVESRIRGIPSGANRAGKLSVTKTGDKGWATSFVVSAKTDKGRNLEVMRSNRVFFGNRRGEHGPGSQQFEWKW